MTPSRKKTGNEAGKVDEAQRIREAMMNVDDDDLFCLLLLHTYYSPLTFVLFCICTLALLCGRRPTIKKGGEEKQLNRWNGNGNG
jgi:hypothetical protein